MKRLLSSLILFFLATGIYAQNYTITGSLTTDSLRFSKEKVTKIYLKHTVDGESIAFDSAEVRQGTFRFEGTAPKQIEMVSLGGFDNGEVFFLLESGDIRISPFSAQFPAAAQVHGTENNEIFTGYMKLMEKNAKDSRVRMKKVFDQLPKEVMQDPDAMQPYQYATYHANSIWYKVDIMDYLLKHSDSPAALYMIRHGLYKMFTPAFVEQVLLASMPEQQRQHPVYEELLNQLLADNLQVGAMAPDVKGNTPDGKSLSLSDLRGKYVLLDIWASWCGPCRREFPFMHQVLKNTEASDAFVILSYSIDSKASDWTNCIEKSNLCHKNWLHTSTLKGWGSLAVKLYGADGVPFTVLISPEGRVMEFNLRGEAMVNKITSLVEGNQPAQQEQANTDKTPATVQEAYKIGNNVEDDRVYAEYCAITPRSSVIGSNMTVEQARDALRATKDRIRFVLEHAESPIAPLMLEKEIHQILTKEYVEQMLHIISPKLKEHPYYISYKRKVEELK